MGLGLFGVPKPKKVVRGWKVTLFLEELVNFIASCRSYIPFCIYTFLQGRNGLGQLKRRSLHDSSTLLQEDKGRLQSNP